MQQFAWPQQSWNPPQQKDWQAQTTKGTAKGTQAQGKPVVRTAAMAAKPAIGTAAGVTKIAAGGKGGLKGNAGTASDRSRTPPPKPVKPANTLPPDWEEHFSEEYGIPYYWNSKTAES